MVYNQIDNKAEIKTLQSSIDEQLSRILPTMIKQEHGRRFKLGSYLIFSREFTNSDGTILTMRISFPLNKTGNAPRCAENGYKPLANSPKHTVIDVYKRPLESENVPESDFEKVALQKATFKTNHGKPVFNNYFDSRKPDYLPFNVDEAVYIPGSKEMLEGLNEMLTTFADLQDGYESYIV